MSSQNAYGLTRWGSDVFVRTLDSDGNPVRGWKHVKRAVTFTIGTPETEDAPIYGTARNDFGQTIYNEKGKPEQTLTLEIGSDFVEELKWALFGTTTSFNQAAATVTGDIALTTYQDEYVQIVDGDGNSLVNLDPENPPVCSDGTEGTDYEIDYSGGLVKTLSAGSISDESVITFSDIQVLGDHGTKIVANQNMSQMVQIKVLAKDQISNGVYEDFLFHKVQLGMGGELPLINERTGYQQYSFTGTILTPESGEPFEVIRRFQIAAT